ncbi:hypothetical protein [uncultured Parolsenella sp.]|nr:hypothetical protein [uncultured Parolsenella sp.]
MPRARPPAPSTRDPRNYAPPAVGVRVLWFRHETTWDNELMT